MKEGCGGRLHRGGRRGCAEAAARVAPRGDAPSSQARGNGVNEPAAKIRVLYFAGLREARGRSDETVETAAATPAALYRELAERHGFPAVPEGMRVAVNDGIADWQTALADGDTVVFLTPFGGGR